MREREIVFVRALGVSAVILANVVGCKAEPPAVESSDVGSPSTVEARPNQAMTSTPVDPERAEKLADLDTMCKALNYDYDDGTLTDYYREVRPKTAWGLALRDAGNESIQPGRLLETAMTELSAGANEPALANCRTLLDYIDDVE